MTEHQADRLAKARESIEAAGVLLREGFAGFSASRSYYAMFYTAEAILLRQDLAFSSHAAVHPYSGPVQSLFTLRRVAWPEGCGHLTA